MAQVKVVDKVVEKAKERRKVERTRRRVWMLHPSLPMVTALPAQTGRYSAIEAGEFTDSSMRRAHQADQHSTKDSQTLTISWEVSVMVTGTPKLSNLAASTPRP